MKTSKQRLLVLVLGMVLLGCSSSASSTVFYRFTPGSGLENYQAGEEEKRGVLFAVKNEARGQIKRVIFYDSNYYVFVGQDKGMLFILELHGIDACKIKSKIVWSGEPANWMQSHLVRR